MSYTFKLARRTARFRFTLCSAFLLAALACNKDEPVGPTSELTDPAAPVATEEEAAPEGELALEEEVANEDGIEIDQGAPVEAEGDEAGLLEVASVSASGSASARRTSGIPFGDFHVPTTQYGRTYSSSLVALWPSTAMKKLAAARANGMRVVISMAGHRRGYTDRGRFNFSKWKARINVYKKYNFDSYIKDGTIIGHYLTDEPQCAKCWGGKKITASQIDQMARYSKSLWPNMATAVRSAPSALPRPVSSRLDFAWAQWEGPHVPSYRMTAQQFRDKEVAAAKARGLGLVFGMNYVNGGSGSSRIPGSYKNARKVNRWAMSAAEVRKIGSVLAASSYACALISWQYDTRVLRRSGMKSALQDLARIAERRSRSSCKR